MNRRTASLNLPPYGTVQTRHRQLLEAARIRTSRAAVGEGNDRILRISNAAQVVVPLARLRAATAAAWMLPSAAPTPPPAPSSRSPSTTQPAARRRPARRCPRRAVAGRAADVPHRPSRAPLPATRYPTSTTPRTRRRLRLPDHHPNWPEPNPAWIHRVVLVTALSSMSGSSSRCRNSWTAVKISSSPKRQEHDRERRQQGRAEGDDDRPYDQREDDAEGEQLVLVLLRDCERGHGVDEDEQVVDRQGASPPGQGV